MLCLALSWASSEQVSFQRQLPESYVGIDSLTLAVTLTNTGTTPLNITPVTTTFADFGGFGSRILCVARPRATTVGELFAGEERL
jgi:hypothetical protein